MSTRTTPTPEYESLRSAAARTGYSIFTFRELIDRGELLGPVGPNLGLPQSPIPNALPPVTDGPASSARPGRRPMLVGC